MIWINALSWANLFNAGPIFSNDNGTKLLCEGHASLETSLKQKLIALSGKVFRGKGPLAKVNRADNRLVFLYSDLAHDEVVNEHQSFEQFLATSILGELPASMGQGPSRNIPGDKSTPK
jgi:hypothetical protein